ATMAQLTSLAHVPVTVIPVHGHRIDIAVRHRLKFKRALAPVVFVEIEEARSPDCASLAPLGLDIGACNGCQPTKTLRLPVVIFFCSRWSINKKCVISLFSTRINPISNSAKSRPVVFPPR